MFLEVELEIWAQDNYLSLFSNKQVIETAILYCMQKNRLLLNSLCLNDSISSG